MPAGHTRRGVLGRIAGTLGTLCGGGATTATATADTGRSTSPGAPRPAADTVDWLQYASAREPRQPATDLIHHLASGLKHTTNASGDHMFALGGRFAIATPDDLPPTEAMANTESQSVRVVNQTPMRLSVDLPATPVALYPDVKQRDPPPVIETVGTLSGIALGALKRLGFTMLQRGVWWLSLLTAAVFIYKHFIATDHANSNIHQWHGFTPLWNDLQGAHHARVEVTETTTGPDTPGRLVVASQTRHTANVWRLTFRDGLADVTALETPTSVLGDRPRPATPYPTASGVDR